MFFKINFFVLILCVLGYGKPLDSTGDMSQFFGHRIVGGIEAADGYAPYMAALVVGRHLITLVCGGSIIGPNLILTAAHCIDVFVVWDELVPTFHATVGSNRWETTQNAVQFKHYHIHPEWSWQTLKNDIGFLVLKEELVFSSTVGTIGVSFERIGGQEPCFVTGWGLLGTWPNDVLPWQLQILDVETLDHDTCTRGMQEIADYFGTTAHEVSPDVEICTFHSVGHGMCSGDSGSALVSRNTNTQIGIVSWGFPCAIGAPDVFARMSGFQAYYEEITALYK